jgi:hypothetical protein
MRAAVFAVFFIALVGALATHFTAIAEEKKEETKTALTDAQKDQLRRYGLNPDVMKGGDLIKMLSGGCDYDPYPILERAKSSASVQVSPKAGNPDGSNLKAGIHPTLACRLTKLMQAYQRCNIRINSAYRSPEQQASMCGSGRTGCARAGTSCHQYGLAVDISSSCQAELARFLGVKTNRSPGAQQFGLHFAYQISSLPNHIQCVENGVAACSQNTKPCDGNGAIAADSSFQQPGASPSQNFAQQVRQWLMPQQQPMMQPPLMMQPLPQMQGITNAFNEPQQEVKPSVSDSLVKDGEKTGSTTADKLEDLAFGKKKETPAQTATSVPVYLDGSDVGGVASKGKEEPVTATAGIGGSVTQTTFAINEFGEGGAPTATGFEAILASIRTRLQAILIYLKPFGRPVNEAHLHE